MCCRGDDELMRGEQLLLLLSPPLPTNMHMMMLTSPFRFLGMVSVSELNLCVCWKRVGVSGGLFDKRLVRETKRSCFGGVGWRERERAKESGVVKHHHPPQPPPPILPPPHIAQKKSHVTARVTKLHPHTKGTAMPLHSLYSLTCVCCVEGENCMVGRGLWG